MARGDGRMVGKTTRSARGRDHSFVNVTPSFRSTAGPARNVKNAEGPSLR